MAVIWGSNFTVIKKALEEIPPIGFNLLRLALASVVLMAVLPLLVPRASLRAITRRDWTALTALGIVGHTLYQLAFMLGLPRTSIANTALIFSCTPIVIALMTAALGHERVPPARWAGALLSAFGIYLVIGHGGRVSADSLRGDVWIAVATLCWAVYTVAAAPLLVRHAPVTVTALSMSIGTLLYLPFAVPDLRRLDWARVTIAAWAGVIGSSLLALVLAYLIWYTAVKRLGSTRTSVYSNVVPLFAMAVAAIWLGEPITARKIAGACAVLAGVAITKIEPRPVPMHPET